MTWAPDYCTSSELKSYLKIDDTADDTLVALWVTTVSRNVDDHCGRQFGQVAALETREYVPVWDRHLGAYVAETDTSPNIQLVGYYHDTLRRTPDGWKMARREITFGCHLPFAALTSLTWNIGWIIA